MVVFLVSAVGGLALGTFLHYHGELQSLRRLQTRVLLRDALWELVSDGEVRGLREMDWSLVCLSDRDRRQLVLLSPDTPTIQTCLERGVYQVEDWATWRPEGPLLEEVGRVCPSLSAETNDRLLTALRERDPQLAEAFWATYLASFDQLD